MSHQCPFCSETCDCGNGSKDCEGCERCAEEMLDGPDYYENYPETEDDDEEEV